MKSIQKRVSMIVLTVILLSSLLLAGCQPFPYEGEINIVWDYTYLLGGCDFSGINPIPALAMEEAVPASEPDEFPMIWYYSIEEFEGWDQPVGDYIAGLIDDLLWLSSMEDAPIKCTGFPTDVALYMRDSKGTRMVADDTLLSDFSGSTETTYLWFGPRAQADYSRLTLFGYIMDDGKSCTLWSLDGTRNIRPDEKCGGDVELVCTVKLVDMELKYECEEGYDWLGYDISHDPNWVSWAHKFASQNGRK